MLPQTQHFEAQDTLFRPVTLSLHNNQNRNKPKNIHKNIEDNDHDQEHQDEYGNNLFNIYSEDSHRMQAAPDEQKGNGELIEQLCELLGVNHVVSQMDKSLYERIQRVLEAVQFTADKYSYAGNKTNSNRLALNQLGSQHNLNKQHTRSTPQLKNNAKIHMKTQQARTYDKNGWDQNQDYSPMMKKSSNFCPANTYSATKQTLPIKTTQKSQSKQKKAFTQIENQPSIKHVKSTKLFTHTISTGKSRALSKKNQSNHQQDNSKQKVYKIALSKKQLSSKLEQRSSERKDLVMTRNPSAMSITAFTTRNKLGSKQKNQKEKSKQKGRSNSKGNSYNNSKQSTGKLSKFNSSTSKMKIARNDSLRRICTDQDYQRMTLAQEEDDEKLFTNKHRIKTFQSDTYPQAQFIQNIIQLQDEKNKQESELQQTIKSLKQQILNEKLLLANVEQSISAIKKQQQNLGSNNTFIYNKKKQVHKKLESMWNQVHVQQFQVKLLNANISGVRESNEEILANVLEERQLVEMYNKVIQEIKLQLKIETDQKDELKRLLKQSKKNEQVSRIKAHATKQKTEVILDNVRESINKWMV